MLGKHYTRPHKRVEFIQCMGDVRGAYGPLKGETMEGSAVHWPCEGAAVPCSLETEGLKWILIQ